MKKSLLIAALLMVASIQAQAVTVAVAHVSVAPAAHVSVAPHVSVPVARPVVVTPAARPAPVIVAPRAAPAPIVRPIAPIIIHNHSPAKAKPCDDLDGRLVSGKCPTKKEK